MKEVLFSIAIATAWLQSSAQSYQPFTQLTGVDTAGSVQVRIGAGLNAKVVFREGSNFVKIQKGGSKCPRL